MKPFARFARAFAWTVLALGIGIAYPLRARGAEIWTDVRFHYPWLLLGLLTIPFVWTFGTFGQDRRIPRLRIGTTLPFTTGPRGHRVAFRDVPGVLRATALAFLIVAIARPYTVLRGESGEDKGIDIAIVMDLSNSMQAVLDADPRDLPGPKHELRKKPTRLDVAKIVVKDFIERRKSDRIAAIVFGKSAYVLSPPTLDYRLLRGLVDKLKLGIVDGHGTAIGDALGSAVARLRKSDARSKVVILLTDGDNNAGSVSPEYASHLATTVGAKVFTIQIGNGDEVEVEYRDMFNQPYYQRERYPVNPELLQKIAKDTGGQSFIATDGKALAQSMHSILDQLEKTRFEASVSAFEDLFPLLVGPGVLLLVLDALLRAWVLRRFP